MKYLIVIISLALILVSVPQVGNTQEIDFDALFQTLHSMQTNIDMMVSLAKVAQEGKVTVLVIGDITFTAEQTQVLVDQYVALKAELATLYQQLP